MLKEVPDRVAAPWTLMLDAESIVKVVPLRAAEVFIARVPMVSIRSGPALVKVVPASTMAVLPPDRRFKAVFAFRVAAVLIEIFLEMRALIGPAVLVMAAPASICRSPPVASSLLVVISIILPAPLHVTMQSWPM